MGESRFEVYVRETLAEGVKARRDALQKAFDDEKAKIKKRIDTLKEIMDEGLKALNAKIDAQAKKWGWTVDESTNPAVEPCNFTGNCNTRFPEARTEYDYGRGSHFVTGAVKAAEDALSDFDEKVKKAGRRLVVCKVDLHMKPQEFDKMMAGMIADLIK